MTMRLCSVLLLGFGILIQAASAQTSAPPAAASFTAFLQQLWPDAEAQGISKATFDLAFAGLTPDPRVVAATRRQPEYGKPLGAYVGSIVSAGNISAGQHKAGEWSAVFDAVEKTYGVDRWIILAIWGMESSYGADKDRWDVFRSLATLAQARFREPYFRDELLVALKILQDGHIAREQMLSS